MCATQVPGSGGAAQTKGKAAWNEDGSEVAQTKGKAMWNEDGRVVAQAGNASGGRDRSKIYY